MHPVPLEIYRQLGSHKFLAMTGAKQLVGSEDALMFSLPASLTKGRGNKFRITLMPTDTYKLELMKLRGVDVTWLDTREDIYADVLREVFTRMTGLDTSL